MFNDALSLLLALFFAPLMTEDEDHDLLEGQRALYADAKAVMDLAEFDLGSISAKDAADWAVLRIDAHASSGGCAPVRLDKEGKATLGPVINRGVWERVASLNGAPKTPPKGKYDFLENAFRGDGRGHPGEYYPLYFGGFVLAQHFPDKPGKAEFGKMLVLPEAFAEGVAAAYRFRVDHAGLFGEPLQEQRLVKLLRDENPMIAVMAAQRLAKSKRLGGKALDEALGRESDLRSSIAVCLAVKSRFEAPDVDPDHVAASVAQDFSAAIRAADQKTLRMYVVGFFVAGELLGHPATVPVLKRCSERAASLRLHDAFRKELDFIDGLLGLEAAPGPGGSASPERRPVSGSRDVRG